GGGADEAAEHRAGPHRLLVLRLPHRGHPFRGHFRDAAAEAHGEEEAPAHGCLLCHRGGAVHGQRTAKWGAVSWRWRERGRGGTTPSVSGPDRALVTAVT